MISDLVNRMFLNTLSGHNYKAIDKIMQKITFLHKHKHHPYPCDEGPSFFVDMINGVNIIIHEVVFRHLHEVCWLRRRPWACGGA